jgi:hypothetical protein
VSTLTEKNYRKKEAVWAQLGTIHQSVVQGKIIKTVRPWALLYCDNETDSAELRNLFLVVHYEQLRKEKPTLEEMHNEEKMMRFLKGAYSFQRSGYGFEDLKKGLISFTRDSDISFIKDRDREDILIDFLLDKRRESTLASDGNEMALVEDLIPSVVSGSSSSSIAVQSGNQKKRKANEAITDTGNDASMVVENNPGTDKKLVFKILQI